MQMQAALEKSFEAKVHILPHTATSACCKMALQL
jgi:hypothetical protein